MTIGEIGRGFDYTNAGDVGRGGRESLKKELGSDKVRRLAALLYPPKYAERLLEGLGKAIHSSGLSVVPYLEAKVEEKYGTLERLGPKT